MPSMSIFRGGLSESGLSKSVAGSGTLALTPEEARNRFLRFTGALTGNRTIVLPVVAEDVGLDAWSVWNDTTGAFSLTVAPFTGSGVAIPQGETVSVQYNGSAMTAPEARSTLDYLQIAGGTRVDVKAFGGDPAAADNLTAFTNAVAALDALGGGVLFVGRGTYLVGGTVALKDNMTLRGAGMFQTVIKLKDGVNSATNVCVIANDDQGGGNSNIQVLDLTADLNRAGNPNHQGSAIEFFRCSHVDIINCRGMNAISLDGLSQGYGIGLLGGDHQRILHCRATGNERHGIATTSTPTYTVIHGNLVYGNDLEGIHCSTGDYITVSNNHAHDNTSYGIAMTNAALGSCTGNVAHNNGKAGFEGVLGGKVYGHNFSFENDEEGYRVAATSTTIERMAFVGNIARGNGEHQILITKPSRHIISGCVVTETAAGKDGLRFETVSGSGVNGRVVVTGCYLEGGSGGSAYAVNLVTAGLDNFLVHGNWLRSTAGTPVNIAGTPTAVSFRDNGGDYKTEANGTATVPNAATSVTVTHGLNRTPSAQHVSVTPTNDMGLAAKFWVAAVGATTFEIHTNVDPGAGTATFAWSAAVR